MSAQAFKRVGNPRKVNKGKLQSPNPQPERPKKEKKEKDKGTRYPGSNVSREGAEGALEVAAPSFRLL
jgi:hypothetical protein